MKLLRSIIISAVILSGAIGAAYSIEDTVADFDTGADPINWGGITWAGGGGGTAWAANDYSSVNRLPSSGSSFRFYWGNVLGTGDWAGGVLTNLAGVDVSTYSALSFWIYTTTSDLNINVQIQDEVAFGNDMGRVPLRDYLITGTSVWQNVIIPLEAFRRNNNSLDFKIKEVKWMSEYDQGNEISGMVYIDDVKFLVMADAPASSIIFSGDDKGSANSSDMPGDTMMVWDQAVSSMTSNLVTVTVSTGFACSWVSQPSDKGTAQGTTAYFSYQIRNDGNAADSITFSSQVVQGSTWPFTFYWDKDKSSTLSSGDMPYDNTIGLAPNSTHYLLVGVYIPSAAVLWSSSTIRLTAKDRNGLGTEDNWPAAGNDTITDEFVAIASNTAAGVVINVVRSTATASGSDRPGDTITYNIHYPNVGDTAGTNMIITEAIPSNTVLVSANQRSADLLEYYVGSSWQAGFSAAATKVRWVDSSVPAASNLYVDYTVRVKYAQGNAIEEIVSNYSGTGYGTGIWGGGYDVGIGTAETTSAYNHTPEAGNSLHVYWNYTGAAGRWGGGNTHFNNLYVDVSTYSALSFWIYTPNAGTKVTVQMQDHQDFGNDTVKANLSDYIATVPNTWQNVIIPFDHFRRDLVPYPTAPFEFDFKVKEIKWISEYDRGDDSAGSIYIDDMKFLNMSQAPAGSMIISGADKGAQTVADLPGDSFAWWTQQGSSSTFAENRIAVSTGYAIAWSGAMPDDKGTLPGTTAYFAYKIVNNGNSGDRIYLSTTYVQGCTTWTVKVFWDADKSGTITSGDTPCWALPDIEPNTTGYFLVSALIPAGTDTGASSTIRVTAKDRKGSGANDTWPAATDDDTILDEFVAFSTNTVSGVSISVVRSSAAVDGNANGIYSEPGDQITYTIHYPNVGDTAATNMIITEAIPFNTLLNAPAAGADSIEYYASGAWGGYSQSATKIRWIDASVPAASNLNVNYTVRIKAGQGNPIEDTAADFDSGSDPINWGGITWCGGGGGTAWGQNAYSPVNHTQGGNYSVHYYWGDVTGAGNWAGGVLTNLYGIDISTYDALSFWIYTPNANTNLNLQIQDDTAYGNDMGRVPLRDHLITGASVWQNVIVPLEAFRRDNHQLDLKIKEVKWMAEFDQGNDASGSIYIDDVKFLKMSQAPANSLLYTGADKGTSTICDIPGDSMAWWDQQGSSVVLNALNVKISTTYAVSFNTTQSTQNATSAGDYYFAGKIRNYGNIGDNIMLAASTITGTGYSNEILWDKDGNGAFTSGTDVVVSSAIGLLPNCTFNFLLKVAVPSVSSGGQSTIIRIRANANSGSASNVDNTDFVVSVATSYGVSFTYTPTLLQNVNPDTTAYFPYVFRNDGNVSDTFSVSVATSAGNAWNVWVTSDTNHDATYDAGEDTVVTGNIALEPAQSFYCIVAVYVPPAAAGSATARLAVKDQGGAGAGTGHSITSDAKAQSALDFTAPVITIVSAPPSRVGMIGNKVMVIADVTDNESTVTSVKFTYWLNGGAKTVQTVTSTSTVYYIDMKDIVTTSCTAQYYLEAANQWGYMDWSATGTFSISQLTISNGLTTGRVVVDDGNPDDGSTSIDIPSGALPGAIDLTIKQQQRTDPDVPNGNLPADCLLPSTVYDFSNSDGKDVVFKKPVTLTLLYMDTDKDGNEDNSIKDERKMRVFWWDKYEWRLIGGKVDLTNNTITVKIMHLSKYAAFPIRALTAADYRAKERILTPSGSPGKNDFCQFGVSGDNIKINIYDVNGAKVKELKDGVNIWDGKDENAEIVESGVYIYQIKNGNEIISGTILIVK